MGGVELCGVWLYWPRGGAQACLPKANDGKGSSETEAGSRLWSSRDSALAAFSLDRENSLAVVWTLEQAFGDGGLAQHWYCVPELHAKAPVASSNEVLIVEAKTPTTLNGSLAQIVTIVERHSHFMANMLGLSVNTSIESVVPGLAARDLSTALSLDFGHSQGQQRRPL